jgi:hypothetical protein
MQIQATESILKIKNPSKKYFSDTWQQYQPFVIEDVAKNWGACNNWSHDYLLKHCGNNLVPVRFYKKGFWDDYKNFAYEDAYEPKKEMRLKEYINNHVENRVEHGLECYLSEADFEGCFPEIVGDVIYPEYLNRKPFSMLWYGFTSQEFSSTSHLHFDSIHNIFAQIRGRKRILLFPPSNYLSFYPPLESSSGAANNSKVDPKLFNLELFPNFPWEDKIEFVLEPGEILYIPPFWWHHVTALDENISLSFWYDVKIEDFFRQNKILWVFCNIAPHYLNHAIKYRSTKDFIEFIKRMFY